MARSRLAAGWLTLLVLLVPDAGGEAQPFELPVRLVTDTQYFIFGPETGFPGPILFGAPGLGDIPLNRNAALR